MAVHRQSKPNAPHTPPVSFDRHSLLKVWWIADFPNETRAASVRCDYEGISGFAGLRFPIGDLAEGETIGARRDALR
jgi:hypothetical protein